MHLSNLLFLRHSEKAVQRFRKRLRHQSFTYMITGRNRSAAKGWPAKGEQPESVQWYINGILSDHIKAI